MFGYDVKVRAGTRLGLNNDTQWLRYPDKDQFLKIHPHLSLAGMDSGNSLSIPIALEMIKIHVDFTGDGPNDNTERGMVIDVNLDPTKGSETGK